MVAIKFLVLLLTVLCDSRKSLVPQAILQLVRNKYGELPVVIEVFYSIKKVNIFDETLKLLGSEKQLKITPTNTTDFYEFYDKNCTYFTELPRCFFNFSKDAIFLFDTLDNYRNFRWVLHLHDHQRMKTELNRLVYCEDASETEIQQIIESDRMHKRETYESFLIVKNDQISLQTMTRFTKQKCSVDQLVEINQFSSLERKWKTEKFFMPRIENFHGCELKTEVYQFNGIGLPFIRVSNKKDGTKTAIGSLAEMFDALSTHLNFTATFTEGDDERKTLYDFRIGTDQLNWIYDTYSPSSDPIYFTSDIYVVPPGELYTSWEKLFLPFDQPTWIWVGISFAIAFLVILLTKVSKSHSIYEFIIGSNVSTPSLNVIAIFMGIGQILLPQRNVSRFLFISFILFSLIMRTAYQGKYFEFLTSDMRKKPMQTFEELNDKNFTVIINQPNCDEGCRKNLLKEG